MDRIFLFGLLTIPVIIASRRSILNVKSHGFYRFFAWEGMIWLFASNYKYWFHDPFSPRQIISWSLLLVSAYMAITGYLILRNKGKAGAGREDTALFQFEKTTELVTDGIFRYIRHPLYSSLIILTWGILLKRPDAVLVIVSFISSFLLYLTSKTDEKECIIFFGDKYRVYMSRTRMFIPFIF